jgi:hypothetical protein
MHQNLYHLSGVAPVDDSHRFDNQQLGSEELNKKITTQRINNNKSSRSLATGYRGRRTVT